jgi:hypothetical protein
LSSTTSTFFTETKERVGCLRFITGAAAGAFGIPECKGKFGTYTGLTAYINGAAQQLNQLFGNSQSQTRAAIAAGDIGIGLRKPLKDGLQFICRYANAGIFQAKADLRSFSVSLSMVQRRSNPPFSVNFRPFPMRFINICVSRMGSPYTNN